MAGALTIDTLNNSAGVYAENNAFSGISKAWVNFDGTNGTIRSGFNVSSVTRIGLGIYQVNFTTAFANANYSAVCSGSTGTGTSRCSGTFYNTPSASSCQMCTFNTAGDKADSNYSSFAAFA